MDRNEKLERIAKKLTASIDGYGLYVDSSLYTVCWSADVNDFITQVMNGEITVSNNGCNTAAKYVKEKHDKFVEAMRKNGYRYIEPYNKIYFTSFNGKVYVMMKGNLQDVQNRNTIQKVCGSINLPVKFERI